jgi:peptidoglycan/LPS O-acetylase OafA/YrhL
VHHVLGIAALHGDIYAVDGILPTFFFLQSTPLVKHGTFNNPAWSVSAEMICYLTLPFLLVLARRHRLLPALIGLIGFAALTLFQGSGWTEQMFGWGFMRALPSFSIGIALGASTKLLQRIPGPSLMFVLSSVGFFVLALKGAPRPVLLLVIYLIVIGAFAADVQGSVSKAIRRLAPWGQLTYSLYMIHGLFDGPVFQFLFRRLHLRPWLNNVGLALCLVLLFAVAYASYVYFETPMRRWMSPARKKTLHYELVGS